MTTRAFKGLFASLGLSVWIGVSGLMAQSPPADPWTTVPAFPAACYASEDFSAPADEASAALGAAIDRQETINEGIEKEFKEMDRAEVARRMQAFMLKDPQRAMAMLQAQQTIAASTLAAVSDAAAASGPLEEELKSHTAAFQAAVDGVRAPIQAQMSQLVEARGLPAHADGVMFASAADEAQYLGLMARLNTDYEGICGAWWGPSGAFQTWLRDLKAFHASLILSDEQATAARALQFAILEGPTGGYRSTHAMRRVRDYLRRAREVYTLRPLRVPVGKPGDFRPRQ